MSCMTLLDEPHGAMLSTGNLAALVDLI